MKDSLYNLVVTQEMLESNVGSVFPTEDTVVDYFERQTEIEKISSFEGKRKHLESLKKSKLDNTKAGIRAIDLLEGKLTEVIMEWQMAPKERAGTHETAKVLLIDQHPQVLAHITLKMVINAILDRPHLNTVSRSIGKAIKEHIEWTRFHKDNKFLANSLMRKADEQCLSTQARVQMIKRAKNNRINPVDWSSNNTLKVGAKCIDLLMEVAPIEKVTKMKNGKKYNVLVCKEPTAGEKHQGAWYLKELFQTVEAKALASETTRLPMVCPPLKWAKEENGGYISLEVPLIKRIHNCHWNDYESYDLTQVYDAVNQIQETAWCINTQVLDVMTKAWDEGLQLGKLPDMQDMPRPSKPQDIDTNKEARNKYRRENTRVTVYNEGLASKRLSLTTQINIAERFKTYKAIYFPHSLDFRGRIYPMPTALNPQEDDFAVGLLQFSEGKPLGENGAYWLAVHMANLYDECDGVKLGKLTNDQRVDWVHEHEKEILEASVNALSNTWWSKADKPWQFLATCLAWAGYMMLGDEYKCKIPVQMDGSCNGLQHFSAILRDKEGGTSVNLTNTSQPNDIYGIVADKCNEIIRNDEPSDEQSYWKGRVTRSDVKRPVMTLPYGVTKYGMVDQVKDKIKEREAPDFDPAPASKYLADVIYRALGETISSAVIGMDFLKESCMQTLAADQKPFWVTPSGFPVCQEYFKAKLRRVQVYIGGKRTEISNYSPDALTMDTNKSVSSIAPNFIHSMDAAHLVLSVNEAVREFGIEDFSMVHDSYGTHACNIDMLHSCIRRTFVQMYQQNALQNFSQHNITPELPETGELSIEEVEHAEYFFA